MSLLACSYEQYLPSWAPVSTVLAQIRHETPTHGKQGMGSSTKSCSKRCNFFFVWGRKQMSGDEPASSCRGRKGHLYYCLDQLATQLGEAR